MSLIQTISASALSIAMILAAIFYELYDITKELREVNRLKKLELKRLGFSPEEIDGKYPKVG